MSMGHTAPFEALFQGRVPQGLGGRWFGVYPALVSDIQDPESTGRVKVTLPWSPDSDGQRYEAWARVATLMGGSQRGSWFIPDVNDEVLVVFEGGDVRRPYVIGGLWNGSDAPPETMDGSGRNYKKVLKSRNGVTVTLDDNDGQEQFVAETPGGQKVTLKDGPGSVEIADSNGNSIKLESSGVTITAAATITINASAVTVNASSLTQSGTATISGALTVAASVTTPSVVSGSYTPGAGNIW
jgi:uncharacterized protein involved in type VI secretion and phage assembly